MVKLYYTPTSCGASSFICAYIKQIENMECEVVDLYTHTTESGVDFYTINPKGNVPTIVLDDGTILNENISCLSYINDQNNSRVLGPVKTQYTNYKIIQLLSFLASELHSAIGLLFNPATKDEKLRTFAKSVFDKKMSYLQKHILKDGQYVYENEFSIVDAYLHIILSWTGYVGIDITEYPVAEKYYKMICSNPIVIEAKRRMSEIPKYVFVK